MYEGKVETNSNLGVQLGQSLTNSLKSRSISRGTPTQDRNYESKIQMLNRVNNGKILDWSLRRRTVTSELTDIYMRKIERSLNRDSFRSTR